MRRRPSVVLGASGLVGQRMQQRLHHHPWFEMKAVGGSASTAGTLLNDVPWRLQENRPDIPSLVVHDVLGTSFVQDMLDLGIEVAFSCLPSEAAERIESALAKAGIAVFSNASHHRREEGIPLVIPDVNPDHMRAFASSKGAHACGTNCTLVPLASPLAALRGFGIERVSMRSEQALSGAGWRLLHDQDAHAGHLSPDIPGEAEKVCEELLHVFGEIEHVHVTPAEFDVEVHCQRVARPDGHQVYVEVEFSDPVTRELVTEALRSHDWETVAKSCPSTPHRPLHLVERIDVSEHLWSDGIQFTTNPDPSINLKTGMAVVVGNLEIKSPHSISFAGYSHNTIRGAAGGTLFLAELALIEGRFSQA